MESNQFQKSNILYISNFPKRIQKAQLQKLLTQYGPLISLNIIQKNQFSFAFAEYDDIRDAAFAVKQLNQKFFQGMNLKVQFRNKKLKMKQVNQQEEQKLRNYNAKSSNSPHSNVQTNCNLPAPVAVDRSKQEDKNSCKSPRDMNKNKRSREDSYSDFSLSRSPSRSRQRYKRSRDFRNIQHKRQCQYRQNYKERSRQPDRCREEKRKESGQTEMSMIGQMYEMIKCFSKNIKKLEQKLQDLVDKRWKDQRAEIRRRN